MEKPAFEKSDVIGKLKKSNTYKRWRYLLTLTEDAGDSTWRK